MLFAQNYLHKDSSKRHKLKKINTTVVLTRKIMCIYNVDFVLCLVIVYVKSQNDSNGGESRT